MKRSICAGFFVFFYCLAPLRAQQPDPHLVGVLDEKVKNLTSQIDDLQFQQQQMKKDLESLRAELNEVRRAAGGASSSDLKALEDRIAAVDAARQADKKAIIDQLAKELSGMPAGKVAGKPSVDGKEHTVAKGDTLSAIAKLYGVTVTDLKKANNLTGNDLKVGQKLVIPK
jgi:TolA-binding protein